MIDHQSKDVVVAVANNVVVTRDVAKDPAETALINKYKRARRPARRTACVGPISGRITRTATTNAAGESPLGDVIADAQLDATRRPTSAARSSRS